MLEITCLGWEYKPIILERYLRQHELSQGNMQQSASSTPQIVQPIQLNSVGQVDIVSNTIVGLLLIVLPMCLILGASTYRKCSRAYRTAVLLRQIQTLERMWQISSNK
jgi:hypothetical protein